MEEAETFLSLGSNLGDRLGYLKQGVKSIAEIPGVRVLKISSVYETEPVGFTEQPDFLNIVAAIKTAVQPRELLRALKEIEEKIGRTHRERWREREIDIDIIFYGGIRMVSEDLTIPHRSAHLRRFVLEPLSEIAGNFEHPALHKTVLQLLESCTDKSAVHRLEESACEIN